MVLAQQHGHQTAGLQEGVVLCAVTRSAPSRPAVAAVELCAASYPTCTALGLLLPAAWAGQPLVWVGGGGVGTTAHLPKCPAAYPTSNTPAMPEHTAGRYRMSRGGHRCGSECWCLFPRYGSASARQVPPLPQHDNMSPRGGSAWLRHHRHP